MKDSQPSCTVAMRPAKYIKESNERFSTFVTTYDGVF